MKRIVPFLLACLLLFAVATNAFAATYGDIATQPQAVQDAVYKLSALQIVNGYEDGTWRPDGNITRAEFAKIACLAGGYGNSYQSLNNTVSSFPDVSTGLWYTGWVNLAQGAGYMPVSYTHLDVYKRQILPVRILYGSRTTKRSFWPAIPPTRKPV